MNLLIANRGEVAIRIARAAAELGARTVAVHSRDDAESLHIRKAEHAVELRRRGTARLSGRRRDHRRGHARRAATRSIRATGS